MKRIFTFNVTVGLSCMFFFLFIAASWVVSPLLSGLTSSIIFVLIRRFILSKVCLKETLVYADRMQPNIFLCIRHG